MTEAMGWVVYCTLVSGILALGAIALEGAARASGRPGRWSWMVALIASVVVPVLAYLRPVHVAMPDAPLILEPINAIATAPAVASAVSPSHTNFVLIFYATASLLVLGAVAISYIKLFFMRRTWTRANVNDVPVLLSYDVGPAALGVVSGDIVLPRWVLALERRALSLMLLHEREHLRAGDPRLMLASLLLVALMPWNVVMWVMVHRLRLAIELDCDARVLTADPDPVAYGAVLIEVGRRRAGSTLALSTFAEPRPHLEKRIRRMAEWPGNRKLAHAALLGAAAMTLTGAAYAMRTPTSARVVYDEPAKGSVTAPADTVPPRLIELDDLRQTMNSMYPPLLRDAGISGTVGVMIFVGPNGKGTKFAVSQPDEHDALNKAAMKVASTMQFAPAIAGGRRVSMWVQVSISFTPEVQSAVMLHDVRYDKVELEQARPGTVVDTVIRLNRNRAAYDTVIRLDKTYTPPPAPAAARGPVGRIKGRVTSGGSPVRGGSVTVKGTSLGNVIDENGEYFINQVPVGKQTIQVSSIGTKSVALEADVVEGSTTTLNFMVEVSAIDLSPLTTDVDARATDAPAFVPPPRVARSNAMATGLAAAPVFTPMTLKPKLLNPAEVQAAIARNYPALLKDAGIEGTVKVWFFINEDGRSVKQTINTPSGYAALDQAALKIAPLLRFTPAQNGDVIVPVWVSMDVVFTLPKPAEN